MSRRQRRRGGTAGPGTFRFDPFLGDPVLTSGYNLLATGAWESLDSLFARHGDWLIVESLTASDLTMERYEQWATDDQSARSLTALAAARIRRAWTLGGQTGPSRSDALAALSRVGAELEIAEVDLRRAIALDAGAVLPWSYLLTTGRGLSVDLSELQRRFTEAHNRVPFHPAACTEMLQCLSAKWAGSHEEMFEFARWIETHADAAAPAREALPRAHLEFGISDPDHYTITEYLKQPSVTSELATGLEGFLAACSDPAHSAHLSTLNHYGLVLIPAGPTSADLVDECFQRIGSRPTEAPWAMYGEHIAARFSNVRSQRLRESQAFLP